MIPCIILEYTINLIFLMYFHIHMFQLNSYTTKKHLHWMKTNFAKITIQLLLVILPTILLIFNKVFCNIIAIIILAISIIYNLPKSKSKISLKFTSRVKRMLFTEIILITLILLINGFNYFPLIKLGIANLLSIILFIVANWLNHPIEYLVKEMYKNQAKKIIQDMPNLTVIGVTGTYGKTSVKNFLAKTLSAKYEVLATPKNYNTAMGVVKTIREYLKPTHQIFICEMGAVQVGDIKEICDIVKPKIGIITSIGPRTS